MLDALKHSCNNYGYEQSSRYIANLVFSYQTNNGKWKKMALCGV